VSAAQSVKRADVIPRVSHQEGMILHLYMQFKHHQYALISHLAHSGVRPAFLRFSDAHTGVRPANLRFSSPGRQKRNNAGLTPDDQRKDAGMQA
jgi:hypothetical protein